MPVVGAFFTPDAHPNLQIAPNAPLGSQANQIVFTTPPHVVNGGTLFIYHPTNSDLSSTSYNSENDSSDDSVSGSEYAMFSNLNRALRHHELTSFEAILDEGFRVGDSDSNPETSRSSDGLTSSIGTKRSHDEIGSDDSDDSDDIFGSVFDEYTESYISTAAITATPINLTPNVGIALGTIDRTAMQEPVTPITRDQLARIFEGAEEGADNESVENEGSSDYQDGEIVTSNPDLAGNVLDYDLGFNFDEI